MKHFVMLVICAISVAVVLPFSFVAKASAVDEPDLLNRRIKATTIKGESIAQVIGDLTADYAIPAGIEIGDEKIAPRREINLDLPETT
jgi:hypothetical protein